MPSPFQVSEAGPVRALTFDAQELVAAIPAHLLSAVAPPQHRITLQIPSSGEDSINQVVSTTLGKVYSACPHLFSQPITEANDIAIRLAMPETPVEASAEAPVAQPELPQRLAPIAASQKAEVPVPSANAVAVGKPDAASESPFMVVNTPATTVGPKMTPPPVPSQGANGSPFNAMPPNQVKASPFQVANPKPGAAAVGEAPVDGVVSVPVAAVKSTIPPSSFGPGPGAPGGGITERFDLSPQKPVGDQAVAPQLEVEPQPELEKAVTATGEPALLFGLVQLLMPMDASTLGIEPASIAPTARIKVPLMVVKSQLSSGRVSLSVAQLMQYADQPSKPFLAAANPNLQVALPLKDIFRQLPADALSPPQAKPPVDAPPMETPFSEGARQDAVTTVAEVIATPSEPVRAEEDADESAEMMKAFLQTKKVPEVVPAPEDEVFTDEVDAEADTVESEIGAFPEVVLDEESVAASGQDEGLGEFDALGAPMEIEIPTAEEEDGSPDDGYGEMVTESSGPSPVEAEVLGGDLVPDVDGLDEPVAEQSVEVEREAAVVAPEETSNVASRPQVSAGARSANGAMGFGGLDFQAPARDLELRAVFGTEDQFTPQRIAELAANLPGIEGCVLFDSECRIFGEKVPLERAKEKLPETMCRVFDRVTGLAVDLGFETSEAFTIHTSHGVISFYSEGNLCLSVLHEDAGLPAGMSEKLVLIIRGAKRLIDCESGS
tara:strand:- start:5603 stop:7768 length:2166 start_codon:yes stop_codon:yes gene_type:complete